VACRWLEAAGLPYDVATAPALGEGVDLTTVDPARYSHVVFVCGPFYRSNLLRRFEGARLIGLDLSMTVPVEEWNPFDLLLERDSTQASRPDIAFAAPFDRVPIVGVVLVPPAEEGPHRASYEAAEAAIARLLSSRPVAAVPIDTALEGNATGLRTAAEIESVFSRMDTVVTTRLHGSSSRSAKGSRRSRSIPFPAAAS
jgi:hypothetical protein